MAIEVGKSWLVYLNTGTVASPTWTLVANQKDLSVDITQNTIDTTNKSNSGWTTQIVSTRDLAVSFTIQFDQTDATHSAIMSASVNQTEKHWKLLGQGGQNWIFLAYVSAAGSAAVDGVAEFNCTLVRSGTPTYAVS
jgi:predicted secreted protein